MSTKFQIGDKVLVPAARLSGPEAQPFALMERKVLGQTDRSVRVDDRDGKTVEIASRLVHKSLGILVLRVGDLATERTLLEPLTKSVLQFLRLLVPDHDLRVMELRTLAELDADWAEYHDATSHVVLIGHGSETSVSFVGDGPVTGDALGQRLSMTSPGSDPKTFISLACLTGRAGFAKAFSLTPICKDLIAPFQSVHGAVASQFCQSLLAEHLLDGVEMPYAHARAAEAVVGGHSFRRWRNGKLCPKPKRP
jgi:hypothetical protein